MGHQDRTGLLYQRNRYYDSSTGQFTRQDPIGIAGGLNLYGYANGDPVNFHDPFGLDCEEVDEPISTHPTTKECDESAAPIGSVAGREATEFWAERSAASGNLLEKGFAEGMGHLAALWTPETATETGMTLVGASAGSILQTLSRFAPLRSALNGIRIGSSQSTQATIRFNPSERSINIIRNGQRVIDAGVHRVGNSILGAGRQVPHLRIGQSAMNHAPPIKFPFGIRFIR